MAKHVSSVFVVALLVILSPCAAIAQATTGASGHWEGTLQIPGQEVAVQVDLAQAGDKWEGTIGMPTQGLQAFPLSSVAVKGETVTFAMKGIPGDPQFTGTVSKDGATLSGDFVQGGSKFQFTLARKGDAKIQRPPDSTPIGKDLEGSWEGTLEVSGTTLRLVVKLANQAGGPATGTMVSVDQGGAEIPITAVIQTGSHLKLLVSAITGNYEADLKDGVLTGTWTQGTGSWPLVLKRQK